MFGHGGNDTYMDHNASDLVFEDVAKGGIDTDICTTSLPSATISRT